jgi:hypothetical protein
MATGIIDEGNKSRIKPEKIKKSSGVKKGEIAFLIARINKSSSLRITAPLRPFIAPRL